LPRTYFDASFPGVCIHICYCYFNSNTQTCQDIVWIFNPVNMAITKNIYGLLHSDSPQKHQEILYRISKIVNCDKQE
jgi:hypothetical protein